MLHSVPIFFPLFTPTRCLSFVNRRFSKDEVIAFSEAFGELEMHVNQVDGGYERPKFPTVTNLDKNGNILAPLGKGRENNNTSTWHSDKSYMPCPSMATFLHGIEVTREGEETLLQVSPMPTMR